MSTPAEADPSLPFDPTRWDLVRLVASEDPSERARRQAAHALNDLCRIYRTPILAYVRRWTASEQDAEDIAQEFFARRVSADLLANADAAKGRLRSLLLTVLKNFMRDLADRERAQKRGGKIKFVSFEEAGLCAGELVAHDRVFDLCWATMVTERALSALRRHYVAREEADTYDALVPFLCEALTGARASTAAARLRVTRNALQVRLTRLRASYAQFVRQELGRTVSTPDQIEPETRYLLDVLAGAR
jgi:RNA polymerase sigma-70 factor (ECF subfamily)